MARTIIAQYIDPYSRVHESLTHFMNLALYSLKNQFYPKSTPALPHANLYCVCCHMQFYIVFYLVYMLYSSAVFALGSSYRLVGAGYVH